MNATTDRQDLIDAVRAHARKCYEQGWDVVEECYDDADLDAFIGGAKTEREAIAAVAAELDLEPEVLRGFLVTNRDTDGTSRRGYADFREAAQRYEDMSGKTLPIQAEDWLASGRSYEAVGMFGNVVTLRYAR